jgi:nucleoside-diphosphate-sugar epimerase
MLTKIRYNVTAVVRSSEKGERVLDQHTGESRQRIHLAIVPDFTLPRAFDACFQNKYDAVIHTASPYHFAASDVKRELLDPSIIGTKELLKSIHAHGKSVKRVVRLFQHCYSVTSF